MRLVLPALVLTTFAACAACGGSQTLPSSRSPAAPPSAAPVAAATPPTAQRDLATEHKAAYARATAAALRGEIDSAIAELEPFARATATSTDLGLAYWVHNQLTWLRWGRGDLPGALAETELGARALDRSTLAANDVASMRLHALWDRAYLLLELGDPKADGAFAEYEMLAKARDDHDGLAVLTAFFAARRKNGEAAMKAAKVVDVDKDSDLQDLYVIALAFDAGGEHPRAEGVRARICNGHDYLMKPLLLAQLRRERFVCP
jgi:hypothetical protein